MLLFCGSVLKGYDLNGKINIFSIYVFNNIGKMEDNLWGYAFKYFVVIKNFFISLICKLFNFINLFCLYCIYRYVSLEFWVYVVDIRKLSLLFYFYIIYRYVDEIVIIVIDSLYGKYLLLCIR